MVVADERLAKILEELQAKSGDEFFLFIAEKFVEYEDLINRNKSRIEKLGAIIESSELLFRLSEISLVSDSKLPRIVINASDPVGVGGNMYQVENNGKFDYRWIGPNRLTTFSFPIDRSCKRTFILRLFSQIVDGMYGSIKIYLDGELVEHDIEIAEKGAELFVSLPESNRVQDTVIGLFLPKLFKPSEITPDSNDSRKLGVAFTQIEVV